MSAVLSHSASAVAILEYRGKEEYPEVKPKWIKEKQLLGYYNSVNRFYSECLDELTLPKHFCADKLHELLMTRLKKSLNEDKDFRNLIIKLNENYPRFPIDSERAGMYITLLKRISRLVAMVGSRTNQEYASESITSDIPYILFSNLILGNYTISYFNDYKAQATEMHFRRNHLLVRGRPNLRPKEIALKAYFQMMKPTEEMFKKLLKEQFKLWLLPVLSNTKDPENLLKKLHQLRMENTDQKQLTKLINEHAEILEQFRQHLFQLEPNVFKTPSEIDEPTQTMWRDMVLLRMTTE
jgi:hypothetical protein